MKSAVAALNLGAVGDFNSAGSVASAASGTATKAPLRGVMRFSPHCYIQGTNDNVYCAQSGLFVVTLTLNFQTASATGTRRAEVWKNGALWDWMETPANGSGNTILRPGGWLIPLVAGEYVSAYGTQGSGSAMNISGGITLERKA